MIHVQLSPVLFLPKYLALTDCRRAMGEYFGDFFFCLFDLLRIITPNLLPTYATKTRNNKKYIFMNTSDFASPHVIATAVDRALSCGEHVVFLTPSYALAAVPDRGGEMSDGDPNFASSTSSHRLYDNIVGPIVGARAAFPQESIPAVCLLASGSIHTAVPLIGAVLRRHVGGGLENTLAMSTLCDGLDLIGMVCPWLAALSIELANEHFTVRAALPPLLTSNWQSTLAFVAFLSAPQSVLGDVLQSPSCAQWLQPLRSALPSGFTVSTKMWVVFHGALRKTVPTEDDVTAVCRSFAAILISMEIRLTKRKRVQSAPFEDTDSEALVPATDRDETGVALLSNLLGRHDDDPRLLLRSVSVALDSEGSWRIVGLAEELQEFLCGWLPEALNQRLAAIRLSCTSPLAVVCAPTRNDGESASVGSSRAVQSTNSRNGAPHAPPRLQPLRGAFSSMSIMGPGGARQEDSSSSSDEEENESELCDVGKEGHDAISAFALASNVAVDHVHAWAATVFTLDDTRRMCASLVPFFMTEQSRRLAALMAAASCDDVRAAFEKELSCKSFTKLEKEIVKFEAGDATQFTVKHSFGEVTYRCEALLPCFCMGPDAPAHCDEEDFEEDSPQTYAFGCPLSKRRFVSVRNTFDRQLDAVLECVAASRYPIFVQLLPVVTSMASSVQLCSNKTAINIIHHSLAVPVVAAAAAARTALSMTHSNFCAESFPLIEDATVIGKMKARQQSDEVDDAEFVGMVCDALGLPQGSFHITETEVRFTAVGVRELQLLQEGAEARARHAQQHDAEHDKGCSDDEIDAPTTSASMSSQAPSTPVASTTQRKKKLPTRATSKDPVTASTTTSSMSPSGSRRGQQRSVAQQSFYSSAPKSPKQRSKKSPRRVGPPLPPWRRGGTLADNVHINRSAAQRMELATQQSPRNSRANLRDVNRNVTPKKIRPAHCAAQPPRSQPLTDTAALQQPRDVSEGGRKGPDFGLASWRSLVQKELNRTATFLE